MDHQVLFAFVLTLLAGLSTGIGSGIGFISRKARKRSPTAGSETGLPSVIGGGAA